MTRIIAVLGATGAQGGSVARRFASITGWEVRAITRNVESAAALELSKLGVKLVRGDLDDVNSLKAAFAGASAIFGVTDFWQFAQQPQTFEMAKSRGITWNEACYLQEVQQGRNIIDATASVVGNGDLERLVLSSLSDAEKASKGKYTWAYHFTGKAAIVKYLREKAGESPQYRSLLERTSYVQVGNYLDNWQKNPIFCPSRDDDGSFVFYHIVPSLFEQNLHPTPFVNTIKDTGPCVEALILKNPPKTTMLATCDLMSFADYVRLWGEILGVKTKLQPITVTDAGDMFPGGLGVEVAESACFAAQYGWDGGEGALMPEDCGVDRADLSSVESYIKETDWSPVFLGLSGATN